MRVTTYSALRNLLLLGCDCLDRALRMKMLGQAQLNPRWHCLSLIGMFLAQLREPCQQTLSSHHRLYIRRYTVKPSWAAGQEPLFQEQYLIYCSNTFYVSNGGTEGQPVLSPAPLRRDLLLESGLITTFRHECQWECFALQSQGTNSQTIFLK